MFVYQFADVGLARGLGKPGVGYFVPGAIECQNTCVGASNVESRFAADGLLMKER